MKKQTPFGELETLDAHAHFFSHRFFQLLAQQSPALKTENDPVKKIGELTGFVMPPQDVAAFAQTWADELDRHQVSRAMLIASLPGDDVSIAAAVVAQPERIIGALMFDPTQPDAESSAQRAFDEQQLRVLCLFPAMHHYSVAANDSVRAITALASERPGTAIFVHCGALSVGIRNKLGLPSRFDLRYSNPLDLHLLAKEFPQTNFIIPHFGAGLFREAMMVADVCPNVFIDTSSSNKWMNYEPTPLDLATVFKRALAVVGHERLLFGTDSSFFPRGWHEAIFYAQVNALLEFGASEEQARAIFGGNLKRLLKLN